MSILSRIGNVGLVVATSLVLTIDSAPRAASSRADHQAASSDAKVDFVRDVQPIFRRSCYGCHGAAVHQGSFRLDRRSDAMRGGGGPVIGPGNSAGSRLVFRLEGSQFGPQMPPTGALKADEIRTIKNWIDQGAEWPDEAAGEASLPPADPNAVRLSQALRAGNAATIAQLAAEPKIGGARGEGGTTPLMSAVLYGDARTVRAFLDGGADPNARNDFGATALMWAVGDAEKARLLVERGADVNAKSDEGLTPLLIAAGQPGAAAVVKLLLERGANPNVDAPTSTAVFSSAFTGDDSVFRALVGVVQPPIKGSIGALAYALRRGCLACADMLVPKMAPKEIETAADLLTPPNGDARLLSYLLAHGLSASKKDEKGLTLLMQVAASDGATTAIVKPLLDAGADVNATSTEGFTALSLAKLRANAPVIDLLRKAGAKDAGSLLAPQGVASPAASPRAAVERSLPLLQQTDVTFLRKSGCVSCHNNTLTAMTVALSRASGIRVDEEVADAQARGISRFLETWRERALQGVAIPGDADTVSAILLGHAAEAQPATEATDAMARLLRRYQARDGSWPILAHRPPLESSDVEVTAASMRALQVYAARSDRAESTRAIASAAAWLATAPVVTTEDRAFQLLGLGWSSANSSASKGAIQKAGRALVATQRADGGWSQLSTLESDAYATGQALVALEQSGALAPTDAAFQRGVRFLLNTQHGDGAWFVPTRALAIQPFFESGFPFGHDQFISAAATGWATMALALASR